MSRSSTTRRVVRTTATITPFALAGAAAGAIAGAPISPPPSVETNRPNAALVQETPKSSAPIGVREYPVQQNTPAGDMCESMETSYGIDSRQVEGLLTKGNIGKFAIVLSAGKLKCKQIAEKGGEVVAKPFVGEIPAGSTVVWKA